MKAPPPFPEVVVIASARHAGAWLMIESVADAAECLRGEGWPTQACGAAYRVAVQVCDDALAGRAHVEAARRAFVAASKEAGVLVPEAN
jgi:hypothetical protein